jgi:hypothetical protein
MRIGSETGRFPNPSKRTFPLKARGANAAETAPSEMFVFVMACWKSNV